MLLTKQIPEGHFNRGIARFCEARKVFPKKTPDHEVFLRGQAFGVYRTQGGVAFAMP